MMPDLNAQQEQQLWAAYRLILQWPKCDVQPASDDETQRDDRPAALGAQEADHADGTQPGREGTPVTERSA
jgi:hypothetical protein